MCFKLDMFANGIVGVDYTNAYNSCDIDAFDLSLTLGVYSHQTESAVHYKNDEQALDGGTVTKVVMQEDPSSQGIELRNFEYYDEDSKSFLLLLTSPSCTAPSMIPSSRPTIIPTPEASQMPSISSMPSFQDSMAPSVNPICLSDDFIGQKLFVPYTDSRYGARYCVMIDMRQNGLLAVDYINPDCLNPVFTESIVMSIYDTNSSNKLIFKEGPSGWSGQVEIVENPSAQEYSASLSK